MTSQVIITKKARLKMMLLGVKEEQIIHTIEKGLHQHFKGKFTVSKEFGSSDISLLYDKDKDSIVIITVLITSSTVFSETLADLIFERPEFVNIIGLEVCLFL